MMRRALIRQDAPIPRSGMTLLEVVLAIAIFVGSIVAVGQIVSIGTRAAMQAQFQAEALLMAETKMDEVLSGVQPWQPVNGATVEENPSWTWSLTIEPGTHPDVVVLTLTMQRTSSGMKLNDSFTLARVARDPQLMEDAATASETSTTEALGL